MPNFSTRHRSGFTLIEILVTVTIILILIVILVAVGSNVKRNAQISATRQELQALAGLVEKFQNENHTQMPPTIYNNTDSNASVTELLPTPGTVNFVDMLFVYPGTKDALVGLAGDKLKINPSPGVSYILDSFGRPISFIPQGTTISGTAIGGNWTTAADRDQLRSSGPDQTTNWTVVTAAQNSDDILSFEAAH